MAHHIICDIRTQLLSYYNRLLIRHCDLIQDLSASAAVHGAEFRKLAALSVERRSEIDGARHQLEIHCREHGCSGSTL